MAYICAFNQMSVEIPNLPGVDELRNEEMIQLGGRN